MKSSLLMPSFTALFSGWLKSSIRLTLLSGLSQAPRGLQCSPAMGGWSKGPAMCSLRSSLFSAAVTPFLLSSADLLLYGRDG